MDYNLTVLAYKQTMKVTYFIFYKECPTENHNNIYKLRKHLTTF